MSATMKRLAMLLVLVLCLNSVTFALASGDMIGSRPGTTAEEAGLAGSEPQTAPDEEAGSEEGAEGVRTPVTESAPLTPGGENAGAKAPATEQAEGELPENDEDSLVESSDALEDSDALNPDGEEEETAPEDAAGSQQADATEGGAPIQTVEDETAEVDESNGDGEPSAPETDATLPLPQEPVVIEVPFTARVRAMLKNDGTIYFGDRVSLVAVVMGANDEYEIRWDYYNEDADVEHGENPWVSCGDGELYSFIAVKDNDGLTYRAVAVSGDTEIASRELTVPKAANRPESDEAEAKKDANGAQTLPMPGQDAPRFELTDEGVIPAEPKDDGENVEGGKEDEADIPQTLPMPEEDAPRFELTDEGIVPAEPKDDGESSENAGNGEGSENAGNGEENGADIPQTLPMPEGDGPAFEITDEGIVPAQPEEPYYYEYERDEDGNLLFNKYGNPIPIVPEGMDIPVEWLRDEDGNLVLDEKGNPIATQFIPWTAQKIETIEDMLDPNRTIDIYADWGGGELYFGDESTLIAVLHGYDNAVYTVQWQTSRDGAEWQDIEGATETRYTMIVTEENYLDYWRVVVTITDVLADDAIAGAQEGEAASDAVDD